MNWHAECFYTTRKAAIVKGRRTRGFFQRSEREATFMKRLYLSVTAGLTLFVFLPEARAGGRMPMMMAGRQMMMNSNMMGRMTTPNMMTTNMMNGNMMGGRMMTGNMTGNMMTPFNSSTGFGGFGNQGFGLAGNGFSGFGNGTNRWMYPGMGAYGSGYGGYGSGGYGGGSSGGYGMGGNGPERLCPNACAPTESSLSS